MLPFMCDDDESRSLAVESYTEKWKSFGEIKHSISCRDWKSWMAFFKNSPGCFKFRGLTRWRLACIIYDIVLITEFLSCFLGNRFCIPCVRWVSQSQTRVLLFYSAVANKLPVSVSSSLHHFTFSSVPFLSVCYTLSVTLCCITQMYIYISSLSHTCSSLTSVCRSFPTTCVISNLHLCAIHRLLLRGIASALRPCAFLSLFRLTCISVYFHAFIFAALRLHCPTVSSITRPSISSSIFFVASLQHSPSPLPRCAFCPFQEQSFWKTVKKIE